MIDWQAGRKEKETRRDVKDDQVLGGVSDLILAWRRRLTSDSLAKVAWACVGCVGCVCWKIDTSMDYGVGPSLEVEAGGVLRWAVAVACPLHRSQQPGTPMTGLLHLWMPCTVPIPLESGVLVVALGCRWDRAYSTVHCSLEGTSPLKPAVSAARCL
jgi:hypothetical protein